MACWIHTYFLDSATVSFWDCTLVLIKNVKRFSVYVACELVPRGGGVGRWEKFLNCKSSIIANLKATVSSHALPNIPPLNHTK
jgi:hypothetical protein